MNHLAADYVLKMFAPEDYLAFVSIHSTKKHLNRKTGKMEADIRHHFTPASEVHKVIPKLEADEADGANIFVCMTPLDPTAKRRLES